MGAQVRESNDSEPSKNEPLKSRPLKNESLKPDSLKPESPKPESLKPESLKPESLKPESLKPESLKPESLNHESSKNQPSKDEPKNVGAVPPSRPTEAPEPPWKRKARRGVFEGDVAVVELRSRLALGSERVPEPAVPPPTVPTVAAAGRLMGGVLMAAAVAGVAGYLWGIRLSTQSTQVAPTSDQSNVRPAPSTAAANLTAANPDSGRPSGPSTKSPQFAPASNQTNALPAPSRPTANLKAPNSNPEPPSRPTAATGPAPFDARGAANDVTSVDAARRPMLSARPISPSSASRPPASADDASEIAAKMKIGAELMANGDIAAARMMFDRAAEAGEAAAAFALAETYDPVALRRLRLRGGIAPDVALARRWYEKARDLGSIAAPERIVRLTQIPQ
jgi:hypothetical protein